MISLRFASLVMAATLACTSSSLATSYAAPSGGEQFEQSYVTTNVNVRSEPSTRGRVVNRLRQGDFVNVGECRGGWCRVDAYGGNGWVAGRFIGRGENPFHSQGPAGPGIPPQEPGTRY